MGNDMNDKLSFGLFAILLSTVALSSNAHSADYKWKIRGAISNIDPTSSPGSIFNQTAPVTIDDAWGVTGTISYFYTPNIAFDVLVGLPPEHKINVAGNEVAKTKHLPPIFSVQYHFLPNEKLQPYVGLGLNYTYFFNDRLYSGDKFDLSDSFGWAGQIGVDYQLNPQWSVGADIRYADIKTDVKVNGEKVGSVDVDPTVYSLNIGYRF